jgi:hypothetical protein
LGQKQGNPANFSPIFLASGTEIWYIDTQKTFFSRRTK